MVFSVSSKRGQRGFTLPEVLVTVAIVAVLAAVVIPAVGSQITKGDLGRITSDLLTVRSGVEQFLSDVRRYPNSVGQLTNVPVANSATYGPLIANATCPSSPSFSTMYTAAEVARWRGPYLNKDSTAALSTGYSTSLRTCFTTMQLGTTGVVDAGGTNTKYLIVFVPSIDNTTALTIDGAMDDGVVTTGTVRWNSGTSNLLLLAIPVQP